MIFPDDLIPYIALTLRNKIDNTFKSKFQKKTFFHLPIPLGDFFKELNNLSNILAKDLLRRNSNLFKSDVLKDFHEEGRIYLLNILKEIDNDFEIHLK